VLIGTLTILEDMLGDLIYELKGKITSQRVLDAEGAKMETSFSGIAKYRGIDGTEIGTYSTIYRPEGVLYGEGYGVITSTDGEIATWTGSGIGKFTGQGKIRFHGPLLYRTLSTGKLAFLSNLVGVYETQIDENQNFAYKVWEWK
jgi:hypothetical protein